jgi:RNA polymerase primary sigma factor
VRRIETLAADSTTLQSYLREISKFPRLTIEQERELGRRIQQRADADALGALVESNLRFVASYAQRYRKLGVPVLDLIHEGNLGLLEGAKRFNPERDEPFITHAAWWVRQSMLHLLTGTVGLQALETRLDTAPLRDGSVDVDVPIDLVADQPGDGIADRMDRIQRERQLDLEDVLPDLALHEIQDREMRDALVQQLECALVELDPTERQVLRLRFGLHSDPQTVPQISERLGLTRRRVRAIESRAEQKLRRGKFLRSYLN